MSFYQIIGILSAVIFSSAYIPYIISIIKGKSTPHPVSWVLWSLIGGLVLLFSLKLGVKETLPLAIFNFVLPTIIAVLSVRFWKNTFTLFDKLCFIFSLCAIGVYVLSKNAAYAITISLIADFFAYLPTLRKTFFHPESEDGITWILLLIGNGLSLIAAIPRWNYGVVILPLYLTTFGIIMVIFILRGRLIR